MEFEDSLFIKKLLPKNDYFELRLSPNVYWVPFTVLGTPSLTYVEITKLTLSNPEQKRTVIKNLFDAIQLFVASDFKESDDTIKIIENQIEWEFYKPGYLSVLTNTGCCASCCSWLTYMLKDKYEKLGIIGILRYATSGHGINYIKHNGWFYIIDLQPLLKIYRDSICDQTGLRKDFLRTKFITGIVCKAKSLEDYIRFYSKYMIYKIPEHIFLDEYSNDAIPIGRSVDSFNDCIFLPKSYHISSIRQKYILNKMRYQWADCSGSY